jgi:RNAse (barnase) inhibitor barstar
MEARKKEVKHKSNFFLDSSYTNKFSKYYNKEILLPIDIFNNDSLSPLETATKYLKENLDLKFRDIAFLLNRSQKTIWGAYNESKNKDNTKLTLNGNKISIPIYAFRDRSLSFMESLTEYIKDNFNLKYSQIAPLLNRDQRTVWTVYQRAKKKRRKLNKNVLS